MGGIKLVVWDSRGRPVGVFAEIACMDPTHIHTSASSRHVNIRMSLKCHPSARRTQSLVSGLWCPGQKVQCQVLLPLLLPVWSRALGFWTSVSPPWKQLIGTDVSQTVLIKCFEQDKCFVAVKYYYIKEAQLWPTMFDSYCDGICVCSHKGIWGFWLHVTKSLPVSFKNSGSTSNCSPLHEAPQNSYLWVSEPIISQGIKFASLY